MKLKKLRMLAAFFAAAVMMISAGCGESGSASSGTADESVAETTTEAAATSEPTTEAPTEAEAKTIGEKQEGDSVCVVALTNETGKNIAEFSVKASSEEEYPDNMLSDGSFENNEERTLYYENAEGEYTVRIVFDDDTESELHNFPFGDIEEGAIKLEGETAYLVYMSLAEKSEVNTKEEELKISADNEADVQEEPTEATEAPVYTPEPTPTEPATQPAATEPPATEAPPATEPATADPNEGCLGDGALFW